VRSVPPESRAKLASECCRVQRGNAHTLIGQPDDRMGHGCDQGSTSSPAFKQELRLRSARRHGRQRPGGQTHRGATLSPPGGLLS